MGMPSEETLFHGSSVPHQIGAHLVARSRKGEFYELKDVTGLSVEEFVESYRPPDAVSRLRGIFLVASPRRLNIAGAAENHIYITEPVGPTTMAHFGWFGEVIHRRWVGEDSEELADLSADPVAGRAAQNYWAGVPYPKHGGAWEWIAREVVIVREVLDRSEFPSDAVCAEKTAAPSSSRLAAMAQTVPVAYEDATSSYRARVRSCLVTLGESCPGYDPDADMAAMAEYIESSERAGFDPGACAGIVYATQHHMHAVATVGIAAEEAAPETWLVTYFDHKGKQRKIRAVAGGPAEAIEKARADGDGHGWGMNDRREVKATPERKIRIAAAERDEPDDLPEASPETRVDLDRSVTKMLVSHADVARAPWRVTLLDVKGREIAEATDDSLQLAFDKAMRSAIKQGFSVPVYLQDGFAQKYGAMPSASKMKGGYFGEWPAKDLDEEAAEKKRHRNPVAVANEGEHAVIIGVRGPSDEEVFWTGSQWVTEYADAEVWRQKDLSAQLKAARVSATKLGIRRVYSMTAAKPGYKFEANEDKPVVVATQKTITETTVIAAEDQAACPCEHGDQLAAEDAPTKMKTLRWHRRDPADLKSKGVEVIGDSYFTLGILGEYIVAKRTPDRRHGKLPYVLWLNGKPLSERGFDTKGDAQEFACAYDSVIPFVAPKDTPVEVSSDGRALIGGKRIVETCLPWVRVTVDPEKLASCKTDKIIDGPRDVYDLMLIKDEDGKLVQYMSTMDQETYIVVMLDVRGGVRGVTEVARGQRSKVYVDPVDILRPVIITGASSFYCLHQHPSGDPTVSASDKRLTKAIKKATEAAAPDVEFMGHYVIVDGAYADCDSGKVTKVR